MVGKVSSLSIAFMSISASVIILIPIIAAIYMGVKKRLRVEAFITGIILFVVFSQILEKLLHLLVLGINPHESFIFKRPFMYMLYGGLAAGIFEETARFLGFKFLIKIRENESIDTGISYGFGHGGMEMILFGVTIAKNLINAIFINRGIMDKFLKTMQPTKADAAIQTINTLITVPSSTFLICAAERLLVLVLQISLSLLVLKAIVDKRNIYFLYAVGIHVFIDFVPALYQTGKIKNLLVVELYTLICIVLCVIFVRLLYKGRSHRNSLKTV